MFTKILELYRAVKIILFAPKVIPNVNNIKPYPSYSQSGEDAIINAIFMIKGIFKPSYLDIGAHDPYFLSNTAMFYLRGARGINIEANPLLIKSFENFRNEDINLNFGVSDNPKKEMDFYVFEDSTLSTFSEDEAIKLQNFGKKLNSKEKVQLKTITEIINTYSDGKYPDFLTLDVEGLDFEILKSINYDNNSPKVICVEASEFSPKGTGEKRHELIDFLCSKGYFEYANTNLNAIMVRNDFWFTD